MIYVVYSRIDGLSGYYVSTYNYQGASYLVVNTDIEKARKFKTRLGAQNLVDKLIKNYSYANANTVWVEEVLN